MRILERRISRQYQGTLDRVAEITKPATRLIEKHMRSTVGNVEITVSTTSAIPDLIVDVHRPLFGQQDRDHWTHLRCLGTTTITATGVLVILNAQSLKGRTRLIDETLLHELGHAVQYGRHGARDLAIRSLRNNYDIEPMSDREARSVNRQIRRDEREAERLERLASQL